MGVCIEPPDYVLGLRRFEHWVFRTQEDGQPSGPGDLDLTIYGLRKYCRLALKGSPSVLLLLFVSGESLLERTTVGEQLQALAPAFVSRRAGRAFAGYVDRQRRDLLGERHRTRARELSSAHGYDTKYAMHALRLAYQGRELLESGRVTLPVQSPEREHLMAVRQGELTLPQVLDSLHEHSAQLDQAMLHSELPEEPDHQAVDAFLVNAYRQSWNQPAT